MFRMRTLASRHSTLLTNLLRAKQHSVLREALSDRYCYGPALVDELLREAKRNGGNMEVVKGLLDVAAPALPECLLAKDGTGMAAKVLQAVAKSTLNLFYNPI